MKTRKLLAILLCLTIMLGVTAGCGSSEPAVSASSEPAAETAASSVEETEAATIADEPAAAEASDEASQTETPVEEALFDIYGPLCEDTVTLTYWKCWPPFLEGFDPSEAVMFDAFYEDLNVKVDITTIGTDEAETKFNLMVASGDYLDLIESVSTYYSGGCTKAISDEVIYDLMPYMETYAPDYWAMLQEDTIGMKQMVNSDNQMGEFVTIYDESPRVSSGLWMRQDWLDAENLKSPTTLEELENVLEIFKNKYGCTDAFACRDDCEIPVRDVFGAYEWSVLDGKVVYGYTDNQDSMKEYLKTAHNWYEKGYFSSDFITSNDTTRPKGQMIADGSSGAFSADSMIIADVYALDPSIEMTAVATITETGDEKLPSGWSTSSSGNLCSISTACENPELAVAYINYGYTDQAYMYVNWGIEGETYTMEDGQPVFTDLLLNNPDVPASQAALAFVNPGFPIQKSLEMKLSKYNLPAQKACYDIFESNLDDSLPKTAYPTNYVNYTLDESDVIAQYESELDSYVLECLAKFITGEMDIDADYDAFTEQLNELGCEEVKNVYQAAYDRLVG